MSSKFISFLEIWGILTRADRLLIAGVALLVVGSALCQQFRSRPGSELIVEVDGVVRGIYPLNQERRVQVRGVLGISEIEIGSGGARMVHSPCPHQLCVRQGWARRRGDVIACIPNRLILKISGPAAEEGVDAVLR